MSDGKISISSVQNKASADSELVSNPKSLLCGASEVLVVESLDLDAAMFKWAFIFWAIGSRGEKVNNQDAQCAEVGFAHPPRLEGFPYFGPSQNRKDPQDQSGAFLREGRGVQASMSDERCPAMAALHQS
jgi:hypothetical protein